MRKSISSIENSLKIKELSHWAGIELEAEAPLLFN